MSGDTFALAACSEMLFVNLPHVERVQRIHEMGFAVEIWDWTTKDIDALVSTGARFTSMKGYVTGRLADDEGAQELLRTAEASIPVAHSLGGPLLTLHGTGLDERGLPRRPSHAVSGAEWLKAGETLQRIAELGQREGVTFALENLNVEVDHPHTPFSRAADVMALVAAVDNPHLRMMFDVYHAQIGEGNLIQQLRAGGNLIGEVQVADVPGRCEPGTGEINYPAIARALADMGFTGTVGLEGWASGDPIDALARFRAAFTLDADPSS